MNHGHGVHSADAMRMAMEALTEALDVIEPLTLDPSERLYGTAVHAATDAEGFWVGWAILDKDGRELWSGKFVPPDPRYRRDTGGETWAHGWHVEDELVEHWAARSAVARLRLAREAP